MTNYHALRNGTFRVLISALRSTNHNAPTSCKVTLRLVSCFLLCVGRLDRSNRLCKLLSLTIARVLLLLVSDFSLAFFRLLDSLQRIFGHFIDAFLWMRDILEFAFNGVCGFVCARMSHSTTIYLIFSHNTPFASEPVPLRLATM